MNRLFLFIRAALGWLVLVAFCTSAKSEETGVVFETQSFRLAIGADGTVTSLKSKYGADQYAETAEPTPMAMVYRGGRSVPTSTGPFASTGKWVYQGGQSFRASRVSREGDRLRIEFSAANLVAVYQVTVKEDYLAFRLVSLDGAPVDRIDLLRLNVKGLPNIGSWVNAASNDQFGICLWGGNLHTNAEIDRHPDHTVLRAFAENEPGLKNATAILFGCSDPNSKFLDAMSIIERDFDLPAGADRRRLPVQKVSYLWAHPTPDNIGQIIHWAKQGGFRMILFSYTDFARGAGHFDWNDHYPGGMADLKKVTEAIRRAGLKVGMHLHYSKVDRNDRYVTPVPDRRLNKVRQFTLAADVTKQADVLVVHENPAGCTLDDKRRMLQVGEELIVYQQYSTQVPFQFIGCQRGQLDTTPAAHRQGDRLGLLDVDTWPRFIRLDQNTDIQDEVARRIAEIYQQTGPYHLIYFDGAEDVHEPFWYHVASSQYRVYRLLDPPPPVCEAAHYTHFSWHMMTRSNAYDHFVKADGMKDFCRLMPCPTAAERAKDFSRINFGWLAQFGQDQGGYAGPDVWEYIASRAAAWDCPISLNLMLSEIPTNPRAEDCFAAMKVWEDARLDNRLTDVQRDRLKLVDTAHAYYVPCYEQRGIWEAFRAGNLSPAQQQIVANRTEHHLFINEREEYELVEIEEIPKVVDGAVKAFTFRRATHPDDTYALVWAVGDEVKLQLPLASHQIHTMRPPGNRLSIQAKGAVETKGEDSLVTVGNRTYLRFIGRDLQDTRQTLRQAVEQR